MLYCNIIFILFAEENKFLKMKRHFGDIFMNTGPSIITREDWFSGGTAFGSGTADSIIFTTTANTITTATTTPCEEW